MPSRLLREGILTSERVEQLDPPSEVFYRRLMSKVDDHGLYDARPTILRTSLYPLRVDRVREADCSRWIAACEKAGLIALYQHDGRPYLRMLDTRWTARSEPKFPLPTPENSCKQAQTTVPVFVFGDVVEDVVGKRARKPRATPLPDDFTVSDRVREWAAKNGFGRLDEHLSAFVRKCAAKGYTYVDHDAAFMEAIREDWARLRGGRPAPAGETATTASSAAEQTLAYLDAQRMTPEQKARADTARKEALEKLRASGTIRSVA
jgi:hypothetical protein